MGKSNSRMNQQQKTGYLRNLGKEKYGIEEYDSKYIDDEGNDTDADRDADILKAMNNDYNLRESQKYGINAGVDGFSKLENGFGDINNAVNSHRAIVDYGTNELKHKNVSSDNDYTAISNSLFNASREKFSSGIQEESDAKYATADKLNALQDKIQERATSAEPVEISSTLTNAQNNSSDFQEDLAQQGANIFGPIGKSNDLEQATEEADSSEASGDGNDYKDKYAFNVKGGLKLSGIKTRGPNSGLNGSGFA